MLPTAPQTISHPRRNRAVRDLENVCRRSENPGNDRNHHRDFKSSYRGPMTLNCAGGRPTGQRPPSRSTPAKTVQVQV